jgi:hypothetical protein
MPKGKWKIVGYDTFSSEFYSLDGEFKSEKAAEKAARARLALLEERQPTASSGGQGEFGIQDQVFIETPGGRRYRYMGVSK